MKQDILIAHPETLEAVEALKSFMHENKIKFEIAKEESYDSEFVRKVLESRKQAKKGKLTKVKKEDIGELLAL